MVRLTKKEAEEMGIPVPGDVKGDNKYGNEPIEVDGIWFQSTREANRWCELRWLEGAGEIRGLQRQVAFSLGTVDSEGNLHHVADYVADFVYREKVESRGRPDAVWREVVEDAKGHRTAMYLLKRKWMWLQHGIRIREV